MIVNPDFLRGTLLSTRALLALVALFCLLMPVLSVGQPMQSMQSKATSLESANAVENFSRSLDYLKKAVTEQASRIEEQAVAIDKAGPTEIQKGLIKEIKLIVRSTADQITVTLDSSVQACEFVNSNIERLTSSKEIKKSEQEEILGLWTKLREDCFEAQIRLKAAKVDLESLLRVIQEQEIIFKEYLQLKAFSNATKVAQQLVGETRNIFGKISDEVYKTKLPGIS
jgi:hypothetical protein